MNANTRKYLRAVGASLLVAALATTGAAAPSLATPPGGGVQFIPGPENPEDLAEIPGSPWVIVSTWQDDGYVSAIHKGNKRLVEVYPGTTPRADHDAELYPDCPEPITEGFYAHGVSLKPGSHGKHTLYVVRHNAREAIEVFEVDARGSKPKLTWVGCVLPPEGEGLGFNSVIWLPDGGLAVTSPATDDVWEWQPDEGWHEVPGTQGIGPNGIEVSPDGQWYYVGGWGTEALFKISRGQTPAVVESVPVGFHIDNVHFDDSGRLLAAGHQATVEAVIECLDTNVCEDIVSKVARIDTDLEHVTEIFSYPTDEYLALGTAAIQVGNKIWIGGLRGEHVAVIKAKQGGHH